MKREKDYREVGFEHYFENCKDLFCKIDPDGNLKKINPNWLQILGYRLSEMEGQPITKFVHPNDHKKILGLLENVVRNKKVKNDAIRFKQKNGSSLWIECMPFIVEELIYISAHDITKTKQTEDNFSDLANLHRTVLDSVVTGLIFARQSKMVWANNAFLNMYNCTLQDIKDQHLSSFFRNKNEYEKLRNEAMTTFSKGEVYIKEIEVYNENGGIRWINISGKAIDPDKPSDGTVWMVQDITERINTDEKFKQLADTTQTILRTVPVGIALIRNHKFEWVNSTLCRMLGYNHKEMLSMDTGINFVSPEDHKRLLTEGYKIMESGEFYTSEVQMRRKDNSILLCQLTGKAIEPRNTKEGVIWSHQDITELKMIEENLREQETKLRNIFSAAPVAIGMFFEERFVECNDEFYKMTGYTPDEIIGQFTRKIVPTDEEYDEKSREYLQGDYKNNIYSTETQWVKKDGTLVDIILRFSPLDPSGTDIKGSIFSALDITERNQALKEIKKLNRKLEEKVLKRTAELEMANRDLEAFAYSVSHDLRSPLRHIDGFLSLMHSSLSETSQKANHYYEKTRSATKRMYNMIEDLLDFSRLGRRKLTYSQIDTSILIREIIEELVIDTERNNVEWKINELIPVKADRAMLKLAFENLISNAIKYSSKKKKTVIEIGSHELKKSIEFYVKDNGIGFDMKFADKLFNVFQRLHTSEGFDGIGIGLANVKQIIKKHGGTVRAESKTNHGATFYITLPK